jgi:hypothetical protein
MTTDRDEITAFLAKRQHELDGVLEKIKELETYRQRQRQLEDIITRIKNMYHIDIQSDQRQPGEENEGTTKNSFDLTPTVHPESTQLKRKQRGDSIDAHVNEIVKEKGPIKPQEIETAFRSRGWYLTDKTGLEMIRRALRKGLKRGIYIKIDRNTWNLKRRAT